MSDTTDALAAAMQRPNFRPNSKMTGAIAWMAKNPVAANLLMLSFLLGGYLMGTQLQQEVFPEIELDMATITVPYPGASPSEAEEIVSAIEQAVAGLDGVKRVTGSASEGRAGVYVEIDEGEDSQEILADLKNAVDRITTLPVDAERPIVNLMQNRREVISLMFYGQVDEQVLKDLVEKAKDELKSRPNVTLVETGGTRVAEIAIEVSSQKLRELNTSLDALAQKVRLESTELPGGGIKTAAGEVLLRTKPKPRTGDEFAALPIATNTAGGRLSAADIGEVRDTFAEIDQASSFNGMPAAMVRAFRVGSETPIEVADAVKAYMADTRGTLPPGVNVAIWNDMSDLFKQRLALLTDNALLSFVLVLFVLGLFMEMRLAFWVTTGIPVSIFGSFVFLGGTDVSINMVSMFAFIVTLGIVVDDAIVVGENYWQKREEGMSPLRAAIEGTREVAIPVTFSVLTTVAAFMPMLFVPGTQGKIFAAIPAVVISVLLISLVESFFILPAHLGHGGKKRPLWQHMRTWAVVFGLVGLAAGGKVLGNPLLGLLAGALVGAAIPVVLTAFSLFMGFLRRYVTRAFEFVTYRMYQPFIGVALRYRYLTFGLTLAVALLIFAQPMSGRLRYTPFPQIELDMVSLEATLPFGSPIAASAAVRDRVVTAAQGVLAKKGDFDAVSRGIYAQIGGTSMGMGPAATSTSNGAHVVSVQVALVPAGERTFGAFDYLREWRMAVGQLSGVDKLGFRASFSSQKPIHIILLGDDIRQLETAATDMAEMLRDFQGVKDIDPGHQPGKPQIDFVPTRLGEAAGLTTAEIGRQVRSAFYGAEAGRQQRDSDELKIMVRLPESERRSEHDIESMMLRTPSGQEIPFRLAATVTRGNAFTAIAHQEERRAVEVKADVELSLTTADEVYRALLGPEGRIARVLASHPGVSYELGGERREQGEANEALMLGGIFAMFAIYALIAIPFRSWLKGLAVLFAVPLAAAWAILAHIVLGYDLSMISMMGILALAGVAVNDSIVLVDSSIELQKRDRLSAFEAMRRAGARRFRPIWLTSLTTFLGLAPMIFETSVQARFLIPMAIALGFGVLFATISSLIAVPAIYLVLEDVKHLFGYGVGVDAPPPPDDDELSDPDPLPSPVPDSDATTIRPAMG